MKPTSMAVSAEPMLVIANGMQKGFILRWPLVSMASTAPAKECMPPMALPMSDPQRAMSSALMASLPSAKPASCSAFLAATTKYAMYGSTRRDILAVIHPVGSKSRSEGA